MALDLDAELDEARAEYARAKFDLEMSESAPPCRIADERRFLATLARKRGRVRELRDVVADLERKVAAE